LSLNTDNKDKKVRKMKVRIQIEAGCPSGRTEGNWNGMTEVEIDDSLAKDFVGNLMEYARQESKEEHWQVPESHVVTVTYQTVVHGYNAEEIEEAIWVGYHEIGKFENGEEIRADAEQVEVDPE
jgi:hypothetical protein